MISHYLPYFRDLSHAAYMGDVEWYTEHACTLGGPVLEIGAGTGRTLLPIARAGVDITGIDRDEGMLSYLRSKLAREPVEVTSHITLQLADMREFGLGKRFSMVTVPYRAFLHNVTRRDQVAAAAMCREHLEPGGLLAMNVFLPSMRYMSRHSGVTDGVWRFGGELEHPEGGRIISSEMSHFDNDHQRILTYLRFEHISEDGHIAETWMQRMELSYLHPGDVRHILTLAGFTDIHIAGGFAGEELMRDGEEMVVTARNPG